MKSNIHIVNFKSINDLRFTTKRINLFIGEPNSGKSNILESLSLFSLHYTKELASLIRYDRINNLFYDNDIKKFIFISFDEDSLSLSLKNSEVTTTFTAGEESEEFSYFVRETGLKSKKQGLIGRFLFSEHFERYKPYRFRIYSPVIQKEATHYYLTFPFGDNLADVLASEESLRQSVSLLLNSKGYKLNIDSSRGEVNMIREEDGVFYTYPYHIFSDTLQRIIFYFAAIESNKDSVLIFEEPEANTFPYYTKQLAERIALDQNSNQFFITTHNPYLLSSIVEKTSIPDLAVNIVYMQDYKTQLYQLTDDQLSEVLDLGPDVFYNLDRFLPEA